MNDCSMVWAPAVTMAFLFTDILETFQVPILSRRNREFSCYKDTFEMLVSCVKSVGFPIRVLG